MRYFVGAAATVFAAAMCFNSAGDSETCQPCMEITKSEPHNVSQMASLEMPIRIPTQSEDIPAEQAALQPADRDNSAKTSDGDVRRDVCDVLIDAARENDLPPSFLLRLIWQESRFDPNSISRAGAKGIAQFMPQTASEVGLADPHDPFQALPASARLLKRLNDEFGNLGLAAGAYNAGSGRIRNWLSNKQSLPQETRNYIRIITGFSPESWTRENSVLAERRELPRGIPCQNKTVEEDDEAITVTLTSEMSSLIRNTQAELQALGRRRKTAQSRRGHSRGNVLASRHKANPKVARSGKAKTVRYADAR